MTKYEKNIKDIFDNSLKDGEIKEELYDQYDVKRGLRNKNGTGVLVQLTKISDVYGYKLEKKQKIADKGHLYYRNYDIYELVKLNENSFGFEKICFLLLFSHLPNQNELIEFCEYLNNNYKLPSNFMEDTIFKNCSSSLMNQIQKSVLSLYNYDNTSDDVDTFSILKKGLNILAKMPSIIGYNYQVKHYYQSGKSLIIRQPKKYYSLAQNLLHLTRDNGEFTDLEAQTLDLALILHADHGGGNNSTFTNIVVSSTATDIYSTMVASLGSLKGARHGGANLKVKKMMDAIIAKIGLNAEEKDIKNIINKILNKKFNDNSGLIYGIGHPIYTKSDPRAVLLEKKAYELATKLGNTKKIDFYKRFALIAKNELEKRKNIKYCPNVDFYSGLTYEILGINADLFTPIFACARIVGWLSHNIENKLYCDKIIRPASKYVNNIIRG